MTRFVFVAAACVLFQLPASAQNTFNLGNISWLAGCWESRNDAKRLVIHEQWMKPSGGLMLGTGRTVESDKAVDFEFMRIEQNGTDLIFYARPRANKEETPFKAIRSSANEVVFENKQHDFPQRVIYRRDGDKLIARIEGDKNGKLTGIDFSMTRTNCDGPQATRVSGNTCPSRNGLTTAEIGDLLDAHNSVRSENKLSLLKWDCKLADTAQEWADRGVFEHRVGAKYGESLYVSATSTARAVNAVQQWMQEKGSWDAKTATCAAGKVCTHYTQIVWRTTVVMGCGINRSAAGNWRVLLVCNYDPAGNSGGPPF